ncbi:MAG: cytochrome b/b6 domain-containing protein, partial [Magnetococcales bacterium]|nr:cytochrome b/b6 domain-containing protein [Magnetococcales bacterium]
FVATGIVAQLAFSLVMVHPKPGRAGDLFYALHESLGQVLLGLLVVHWLWCLVRPGNIDFALLFPWFSPSRYQAIQEDMKSYFSHAMRFSLPENSQVSPLASAVQGLGLLAATLLGVSGVILFLGMEPDGGMGGWLHDVKEGHEVLGSLLWCYLIVHATMAILHQLAGHNSMGAMVKVWKKDSEPTAEG